MKITECPWELDNLYRRVVEIQIAANELIDINLLSRLECAHDYIVVKIESGNILNNKLLAEQGYYLSETQLTIIKDKMDWNIKNDPILVNLYKHLSVEKILNNIDFEELMSLIQLDMFSTDRIYLDPNFGPEYSLRRYKNWIRSEWEKGSLLYKHFYKNRYVGFSLCKQYGDELSCLLAGCFPQYQKTGIGLWIPLVPELLNVDYKTYITHISTNNFPVWQMYNYHQYRVTKFEYVFVKYIKH